MRRVGISTEVGAINHIFPLSPVMMVTDNRGLRTAT